ncbi:MAG: cellulase family glycosylhydrolase [Spirochaetales bacterium]|nr:cellulase family glycosylhydrolase [Spirochaetales bacterium]
MEMLGVKNGKIVKKSGEAVRLRGTCIGGWMNMEHFIDGYPDTENSLRTLFHELIGPEKGRFFFDRLLDYFFAEEDVIFIKRSGATVIRLPLNYRHFERDSEPYKYLDAGFKRLDEALEWCAKHGLYAILDLHSVQGWQNPDWHCDNPTLYALFWSHRHFQDRFIALWEEFARRYKGNPAVAGYNVMNEPVTGAINGWYGQKYKTEWDIINRVYSRVVKAIRAIDEEHIIILEGDLFSTLFSKLDAPFAGNLLYSSHNYHQCGFAPGEYPGKMGEEMWDRAKQEKMIRGCEGVAYSQKHNVPLWVGEFGARVTEDAGETEAHAKALDDQVGIFEDLGLHWTSWTYKCVGGMSWVQTDPESDYMKGCGPRMKNQFALGQEITKMTEPIAGRIFGEINNPDWSLDQVKGALNNNLIAKFGHRLFQPSYVNQFKGMSETEIDRVLQAFLLKNCRHNDIFIDVFKKYMTLPA